jgi:hypothetical protein
MSALLGDLQRRALLSSEIHETTWLSSPPYHPEMVMMFRQVANDLGIDAL